MRAGLLGALCALVLGGCGSELQVRLPDANQYPDALSEWGLLLRQSGRLEPNTGVVPYDLNTPLFSDYAHKFRTLWMPPGQSAVFHSDTVFAFPVGTVFTKTFYYPIDESARKMSGAVWQVASDVTHSSGGGLNLNAARLLETRILYHGPDGWVALGYVWNREQTEAVLEITGAAVALELVRSAGDRERFTYFVPDANQCQSCHVTNHSTRAMLPIGPRARNLNKTYAFVGGVENQLVHWSRVGYLRGFPGVDQTARTPDWRDASVPLQARARAYLDINCAHCHNPLGAANTSALQLNLGNSDPKRLGLCKAPVAAGRGTGDRRFSIVPGQPQQSILSYRMASTDPGEMMPELGRSLVHREGLALVDAWIGAMDGRCASTR